MVRRSRETPGEARARRAAVDDPDVVLAAAARFLEARPRSVAEVRRRLLDRGYRGDLVSGAIARLVDLGMLDDAAFALAWVESRDRARPRGARALRGELYRMGVSAADIEAAIGEREASAAEAAGFPGEPGPGAGGRAPSPASDRDAAARLLARRGAAFLREADPQRRRAKAYALLARNGLDPDTCREAIAAWLAGEPGPGS